MEAKRRSEHPEGSGDSTLRGVSVAVNWSANPRFVTELTSVVPGIIYVFDLHERRNRYSNRQDEAILGYREAEVAEPDFLTRILHPQDASRIEQHLARLTFLADGDSAEIEYRLRHRDGSWRWFLSRSVVYQRTPEGKVSQVIGVATDITEHKKTEETLRWSEERFRLAVDAASALVYSVDLQHGARADTHGLERLIGRDGRDQELSSDWWHARIHPDDLPAHTAHLAACLADSACSSYRVAYRVRHSDGTWLDVDDTARILRNDEGAPARLIGSILDVTDRQRREERLRVSEQRFRTMANTTPAIIWTAAPDGSITFHNQRWLDYTGIDPSDNVSNWPSLILHRDDFERCVEKWTTALREGSEYEIEVRNRHRNGTFRWFLTRATPIRDSTGHIVEWYGSTTDIHDRKLAEEELARSAAFARSVVEASADCISGLTPAGRIVWMNENGKRLMEVCDFDRLKGDEWAACWEAGGVRLEAEAALATARTGGVGRFRGFCPTIGGSPRWWDVVVTPIPGPDGRVEQLLAVSRDVTEARTAEEALREADRRKDEFLAMLAHELRNPLAPIQNAVQLLRSPGAADSEAEEAPEIIERQVAHLSRLVDDLLDVSRVSRGKIQLQKVELDLSAVVTRAIETTRPLLDSRHHELSVSLPVAPICVEGDLTRLTQVVSNLLHNAAKYTEAGGRIGLLLSREEMAGGTSAVIRVRDNGRGIDPTALADLFDLFYQADRNLDRSEGGLGIGLSLVKSLVEMHGGSVVASSAGRGFGSEFTVRLPCLAVNASARIDPTPATTRGRSLRILVVDDNRDSVRSMALLLRRDGHEVLSASDGREAVDAALRERPAVVLLDIGLPCLDGYQACQAMRAGGLTETLIAAMTGYGQLEDRKQSERAGFDAHLVKPVDLRALRQLLAEASAPSE